MTPVAVMVGANRIVPAAGIIHPLGSADLSPDDEKALRRRIVEQALQALDTPLPSSSIPALIAAKCAERQGESAFQRFHERLFTAHFRDNLDIGRPDVLRGLARETALDLERFETDYAGEAYEAVLHDCAEGAAWFGVSGLPTVILDEKLSLVGAVPTERYRLLIDWILAGEPGGVIPLPPPTESTAAGQSRVGPGEAGR